jgi:hypothetical protein
MANPYDVNLVFAELEQELVKSFKRNMHKYIDTSDMWQAMKMKDLELYRREVAKSISDATKQAKRLSKIIIKEDFLAGADKVDAFMKQFNLGISTSSTHDFFRLNRRKLNAMLEAVYGDLDTASHAIYRQMDDVYRQTLFKAQIAKDSGVYTPEQAVDMATKDFLDKGINCIRYANGAMVNVASYAEMAIRTASKRAMLTAEGLRNQEWGVTTIQITQHGSTCHLCSPWQGRVLIDDVYSGGKANDGPYPLLSQAMAEGLFHPNCRHGSGTFFEGISEAPTPYDQAEVEAKYEKEQQQRYNERKIREWKRKANGSMDEGNRRKAEEKVRYWQGRQRELMKENDWLRRKYSREGTRGIGLERNLPKVEQKLPKVSLEQAYDDWFDFENASAMKEYSRTGKITSDRTDGLSWTEKQKQTLMAEADAIQKAAETTQTNIKRVYRGQVFDDAGDVREQFRTNSTIEIDALTATSPDRNISSIYANTENFNPDGVGVIFEIENPKGITGALRDEGELILPKGAKYRVTRQYMGEDGLIHISLYAKK